MTVYAAANHNHGKKKFGSISYKEMAGLPAANPDQLFVILPPGRMDFIDCMAKIEHKYYPPDTKENAKFELFLIKFPKDMEIPWPMFAVPWADKEKIEFEITQAGFRLREDIMMALFDGSGPPKHFPVPPGKNVFMLGRKPND